MTYYINCGRQLRRMLIGFLALSLSGCAWTKAVPVDYDDHSKWFKLRTEGFRVYEPKPLLIVTDANSKIVFVPNFNRGYAVQFGTFLAKNDIELNVDDGVLVKVVSKQDSTNFLKLIQALGEKALEQAGKLAALGDTVEGTIPGKVGVYEFLFDAQGNFTGIRKIPLPDK